jgi:hypothetical protein
MSKIAPLNLHPPGVQFSVWANTASSGSASYLQSLDANGTGPVSFYIHRNGNYSPGSTWENKLKMVSKDCCDLQKLPLGFQRFTYTPGIFRRTSEQRYRHTEMAIPATKFWNKRLLSLLGMKAALSTFVSSNIRYDSCNVKHRISISVDSALWSKFEIGKLTKRYIVVVSMKFSIG